MCDCITNCIQYASINASTGGRQCRPLSEGFHQISNTSFENGARASGESLNRTLIRLLREAVGLNPTRKKRDLSALAGTWSQEEADEFDREVRQFGEIDDELWR